MSTPASQLSLPPGVTVGSQGQWLNADGTPWTPNTSQELGALSAYGNAQVADGANPRYTLGATGYAGPGAQAEDTYNTSLHTDVGKIQADLQSGDYADAFKIANSLGLDPSNGPSPIQESSILSQMLATSAGVNALDPGATWTPQQMDAYYQAAFNGGVPNQDPYGETGIGYTDTMDWGNAGGALSYAAKNTAAGGAPDVGNYGASQPGQGFGDKWMMPIIEGIMSAQMPLASAAMTTGNDVASGEGIGKSLAAGLGQYVGGQIVAPALAGGAADIGLTGALSNELGSTAANALVKGGIGAGVGAGESALTGGNIGTGALEGGVSSGVGSLVGGATGSPMAGSIAGTIAGAGAGALLGKGSTPTLPMPTAISPAAPSTSTPATVPNLGTLPATTNGGTTNIGSYSGFGFQPREEVQNPVSDYATYGQGPEANFFQPVGTPASGAPPTSTTQPVQNTGQPPAVSNTQPVPISIPTLRQ